MKAVAAAALLLAAVAAAQSPPPGRARAQPCAVCHGPLGISVAPDAPNLAGQPRAYLAQQLRAFRSGKRTHEVMNVIARPLTDAEIEELSGWYASLVVEVREPAGR